MKNKFFRTFAVTLAAVLCLTAFSTTAFAGGADPDPAPLPEETGTPTTGGIELDTEDAEGGNDTSSTTEDTENTDTEKSTGAAETMTDEEMAALLSSLLGSQVDVTVTDEGIQLTNKDDGTPNQTGTVVTNGGNLNVRTGAGTDNQAFTQLPNGTQVEVIGTEDNGENSPAGARGLRLRRLSDGKRRRHRRRGFFPYPEWGRTFRPAGTVWRIGRRQRRPDPGREPVAD